MDKVMMRIVKIIMIVFIGMNVSIFAEEQMHSDNQTVEEVVNPDKEEIRLKQRKQKEQIHLEKTVYKTYNFKLQGSSEFILRPIADQQILATIDVYWNQKNVYLVANIDKKEYLEIKVVKEDKSVIINEIFYTVTGFKFNATAGQQYRIVVQEKALHLSEQIIPSNKTAKKGNMIKAEAKMISAENKLKNGLEMAKLGVLMNRRIDEWVLDKTSIYSSFQIFEIVLIALGSWIQVHLVIRLLKVDSII